MAIPDFQTIMLPLLQLSSDGNVHYIHDAVNKLSEEFGLSEEDRTKLLPSGQQPIFYNRVGWARTYLKKAGLLIYPKRGYLKITEKGKEVVEDLRVERSHIVGFVIHGYHDRELGGIRARQGATSVGRWRVAIG